MDNVPNILEMFDAMTVQEKCIYRTKNGLYDDQSRKIDAECRRLMVVWCTQIANHFQCDYHSVAVAINILDRFVARQTEILDDISTYQLAAMTSLYTAVKIHETTGIASETMEQISEGTFSSQDIERTELEILIKLDWHVNSPTALSFADIFMHLIPRTGIISVIQREMIEKLIAEQIDYTLEECLFLGTSACELAFTATCNAALVSGGPSCRLEIYQSIRKVVSVNLLPLSLGNLLLEHASTSKTLQETIGSVEKEQPSEQLLNTSTYHDASPRCIAIPR